MSEPVAAWAVVTKANGLLPATVRESKSASIAAFLKRAPQPVWDFMRDTYGCRVVPVSVSVEDDAPPHPKGGSKA